jgi:hypothetical protein
LFWIVLLLSLSAGLLAGSTRFPLSVSASGVISQSGPSGHLQALLFAPGKQQEALRPGRPVQSDLSTTGPHVHLAISNLSSQVLSPRQVSACYYLDGTAGLAVHQPAVVAVVLTPERVALSPYAGSLAGVEIQTGSWSALSLLFFSASR